ncbi:hypothetical protein D3C81_1587270 [compost metagenome]
MPPGQPCRATEGVIHFLADHLSLRTHLKGTRPQVIVETVTQLVILQFGGWRAVPMQQTHGAAAGLNADDLQLFPGGAVAVHFEAGQITYLGGVDDGLCCTRADFAQARAFAVVDIAFQIVSAIDPNDLYDPGQLIAPIPLQTLPGLQFQEVAASVERIVNAGWS